MGEVVAERGFAATSISEVLRRARVSRETFYEQFSSKHDCFMGAFEEAVEVILANMLATTGGSGGSAARFDRGLRAYLEAIAAHPTQARLFLIEVYAAGPEALRRRAELQCRFVDLIDQTLGARTRGDRFANEALVAAVSALVTARLADGQVEAIRKLHGPLIELARRLH
jgi:AcrR family transcriptional regulator